MLTIHCWGNCVHSSHSGTEANKTATNLECCWSLCQRENLSGPTDFQLGRNTYHLHSVQWPVLATWPIPMYSQGREETGYWWTLMAAIYMLCCFLEEVKFRRLFNMILFMKILKGYVYMCIYINTSRTVYPLKGS